MSVGTGQQHGSAGVSSGDGGGRLDPESEQNPEEQTAALLPEQEEVQRRRLSGGAAGRSSESRSVLRLRGR